MFKIKPILSFSGMDRWKFEMGRGKIQRPKYDNGTFGFTMGSRYIYIQYVSKRMLWFWFLLFIFNLEIFIENFSHYIS